MQLHPPAAPIGNEKEEVGADAEWFEERWALLSRQEPLELSAQRNGPISSQPSTDDALRLVFWNVDSFIDMEYDVRLSSIGRSDNWDLLVLAEAGVTRTKRLMRGLAAADFDHVHYPKPYTIDGSEQGIAIIWRRRMFRQVETQHITRSANGENFTSGMVVLADLLGRQITVVGLHLKSWPCRGDCCSQMRLEQARGVIEMIQRYRRGALLVAGDFNHPIDARVGSNDAPAEMLRTEFELVNGFSPSAHYHPQNTTMTD